MADLAQLNLTSKGSEARLRALMQDVVDFHTNIYPHNRLALAVWFAGKGGDTQQLLELFGGLPKGSGSFASPVRFSLLWKSDSQDPPYVEIRASSVDHFSELLASDSPEIGRFFDRPEVLYFDKGLLDDAIISAFHIVTEPAGLIKGWYVTADQLKKLKSTKNLVSSYSNLKPHFGLVKVEESPDFEYSRALIHVEVGGKWLPISLDGLKVYTFFNDLQDQNPGVFLLKGGSIYRPLKFEEKVAPEYSAIVLERLPDDRYPEVYLRSVRLPEEPAA